MSRICKYSLGRTLTKTIVFSVFVFAESSLAMPASRPNQVVSRRGFQQQASYGLRQHSAFKRFISNSASSLGRVLAMKFGSAEGGLFFVRRAPSRSFTGIVSARPISQAINVPNRLLRGIRISRVSSSGRNLSRVSSPYQWYGFQRRSGLSNLSGVRTSAYSPRTLSRVRGALSGPRLYKVRSNSLQGSRIFRVSANNSPQRLSKVRGNLQSQLVISKVRGGYSNNRLTRVRGVRF